MPGPLALVGGSPVNNKDYVCETTTCFAPAFVLYNGGDQAVEVVSSTTFGERANRSSRPDDQPC